jgi:hypothetical protein
MNQEDLRHVPEELVRIADLKPHPENYQLHPQEEMEHIRASIRKYGIYKNVVIARDGTLLAGHGVVEGASLEGYEEIPVRRMDLDPFDTQAMSLLVGDNEIRHLAQVDDRKLADIIKRVADTDGDEGLVGTGYDRMMLANLVMVTRPTSEIRDHNEAAHWVGMPDYEPETPPFQVTVSFDTEEEKKEFLAMLGAEHKHMKGRDSRVTSVWWPLREKDDVGSLIYEG